MFAGGAFLSRNLRRDYERVERCGMRCSALDYRGVGSHPGDVPAKRLDASATSELRERLVQSALSQAAAAVAALDEHGAERETTIVRGTGLFDTYTVRERVLASKLGGHAAQLRTSVSELLAGLATRQSETFHVVHIPHPPAEHKFLVFVSNADGQPVGCFRTVSQLAVSPQRWDELWAAR